MQYGPLSPPGTDAQQTRAITNKLLISFRGDSFHLQRGIESQRTATASQNISYCAIGNLHLFIAFFISDASSEHYNDNLDPTLCCRLLLVNSFCFCWPELSFSLS